MFERARRRLAIRYLALLAIVLVSFSGVFLIAVGILLQPAFDIAPELTSEQAARHAYERTVERLVFAVLFADAAVVVVVGGVAYYLAGRTLWPIQEAHERQRRFVADASHEMRTPLAAIRATAESALGDPSPERDPTAALRTILEGSERLSSLTSDLLLLAQSERGLLEQHRQRFDLSVLAAETVETVSRSLEEPLAVSLTVATDLVVDADEEEVGRIVANLLDNAVRHGGPGPIRIRTLGADGGAIVEVADRGAGIAAADLERIFEPFYRVRADASAPAGSGLGLAIAADLARRNGGRLTVDSQPGSGATFRLILPRIR